MEPRSKKISITCIEVDVSNLESNPGLRPKVSNYHPKDQEAVRRAYLLRGPSQPFLAHYPPTQDGNKVRRFKKDFFIIYGNWLEYSIHTDAVFCLHYYLWRRESRDNRDAFINGGFRSWKNCRRIKDHVGNHNSAHNEACMKKLAFRGLDESESSKNKGNFLELLIFLALHNKVVDSVALNNAPKNLKLTSPNIQKALVNAATIETVNVIIKDLGEKLFAVLIDEARDTSIKEQMAICLRYVDKKGCVIERFVGMMHVHDTTSASLKTSLEKFFGIHGLSFSRLHGQGYDGVSNMQGQFNGLKALILNENKSIIYVHCFAHQLQLALVHVAKDIKEIASFFTSISNVVNVVGVSCKRRDNLRKKEAARVFEQLINGELSSGKGLNQELGVKRPSDTRWGSHYGTLVNFIVIFPSVVEVLDEVMEESSSSDKKGEAHILLDLMHSFEFIFILHLMKNLLGITNDLSKALQRKDQDIVNALALVKVCKERLQKMRECGWDSLLGEVYAFCTKHGINMLQMDVKFVHRGRSCRKAEEATNLHYYQVGFFYGCIDKQRVELDNRFNKVNTELLLCMACLNPNDLFGAFDTNKLIRLAEFYPDDFSEQERIVLQNQLEIYEIDMKSNDAFRTLKGISSLAKKMVELGKNIIYNLVYRLIKLSMILPVSTTTFERSFSVMGIMKNRLRNRMANEWLNDCLVTYIEKDIFDNINNEAILKRFQDADRKGNL